MDALPQSQSVTAGGPVRRLAPRASVYQRAVKPVMDVLVGACLLLVLFPVLVLIGIGIRLDSPGPALFRQTRIGQHGTRIQVVRFRSVRTSSELWRLTLAHAPIEVGIDAPGLTRMGRLLLKTRLDRLPQLLNVVRLEMSLVGPRPPLPYEVERYRPVDWIRLRVKPGLTCLWQLDRQSGSREAAMSSDYRYVAGISFRLDLTILFRTAVAMVAGRVPP